MTRIVIGERELRALVAGRTLTLGTTQLVLGPLVDPSGLIRAILDARPPDPPQAREFLSPRRKPK